MKAQYSIAGMTHGVVVGTDHAAEAITGFFINMAMAVPILTRFIALTNLPERNSFSQRWAVPEHLYKKVPTADLEDDRPSLPDEAALGVTCDNIDDTEGKTLDSAIAKTIEAGNGKTEHKRRLPIAVFDDFWKK